MTNNASRCSRHPDTMGIPIPHNGGAVAAPSVDSKTAMRSMVEALTRSGWGRHDMLIPSLGYWICNPLGIWLVTLAAFGGPCPAFLAPLASKGARRWPRPEHSFVFVTCMFGFQVSGPSVVVSVHLGDSAYGCCRARGGGDPALPQVAEFRRVLRTHALALSAVRRAKTWHTFRWWESKPPLTWASRRRLDH